MSSAVNAEYACLVKYREVDCLKYLLFRKQSLPPSVVLRREQKWLHMLSNWEHFMAKNYKKVSRTFLIHCSLTPTVAVQKKL